MSSTSPEFLDALETAKLDALKDLAYGASHEINNPLANIAARAQTLLRDETDPERRRALEAIHQQALRAHEMIADLMLFARPPKLALAPVRVDDLLTRVKSEMAADCARRDIALHVSVDGGASPIVADGEQLAVAIKALCLNAVQAIGRGGRIDLEATVDGDPPKTRIVVRDDGPGVAPAVRPHLFNPFFSGREAGRGLGFGLSKCWRIVTEHRGAMAVCSGVGRGAEFTIELPVDCSAN